ncbi:putative YCII-related domain protein [Gigaspora margarita]|uniref:Putative YCII-related domain protein n=1 Tax=Gigaspora margarita TaxID=4874 RepID=A0A8H4ANI4_GIGMA|nr:putative YCII-related domain protein [Gigaspora margarita]
MLSLNKFASKPPFLINLLSTNRLSGAIVGNKLRFSTKSAVLASDHDDPDAGARRLSSRPEHVSRANKSRESGLIVTGGAILSDTKSEDATMIGSVMIMEADSEEEVRKYLNEDPYVTNKVWAGYEVLGFKMAFKA